MALLGKKEDKEEGKPTQEAPPTGSNESKRVADIIIQQIGEMNKGVSQKVSTIEKTMRASTMDLNNLSSSIEGYEERLSQIEKSLDKFIGLYELVTNEYNPFVKKEGENSSLGGAAPQPVVQQPVQPVVQQAPIQPIQPVSPQPVPIVETPKPAPAPDAPPPVEPVAEAPKPVPETPAPVEPVAEAPKPVPETPTPVEPVAEAPKPVPETPTPVEPVAEAPKPVPETPTPVEPVAEAPKPVPETPTPVEPVAEAPKPVPETPTPVEPSPVAEAPKPVPETPPPVEPVAEAPKPVPDAPSSVEPSPVAEAPKPVPETPAPVEPSQIAPIPSAPESAATTNAPSELPSIHETLKESLEQSAVQKEVVSSEPNKIPESIVPEQTLSGELPPSINEMLFTIKEAKNEIAKIKEASQVLKGSATNISRNLEADRKELGELKKEAAQELHFVETPKELPDIQDHIQHKIEEQHSPVHVSHEVPDSMQAPQSLPEIPEPALQEESVSVEQAPESTPSHEKIVIEDHITKEAQEIEVKKHPLMTKEQFVAPLRKELNLPAQAVDSEEIAKKEIDSAIAEIKKTKGQEEKIKESVHHILDEFTKKIERNIESKVPSIEREIISKVKEPELEVRDIPEESYFHLNDGKAIRSLEELYDEVDHMDEGVFAHHVNRGKNDFANWIKYTFAKSSLAEDVQAAYSKEDMKRILKDAIINS